MTNSLSDRSYLYNRHRLSHQQIDRWLGENRSKEFVPEKLKQLEAVKKFLLVTDLFSKNGISFVCLKGPLLSLRIYGDPAVRLSHDIDILIGTKDIESVIKILFENGYHFTENYYWPQKKVQQEIIINIIHHLSFYNKAKDFCVEVHWILMQELPISLKKQKNLIESNRTEMDYLQRKFTVLTKEFELLYLIIHGARHGWCRLKWLVDINEYPVNEINISKFNNLVSQLNAERIIGQTNYLLKFFFNTQISFKGDDHIPKCFIRYPIQSIGSVIPIFLSNSKAISELRYLWLMFPGIYYKYRMIARKLFSPTDIRVIDSSFKIVYCLYRPYSLIKRRLFNAR